MTGKLGCTQMAFIFLECRNGTVLECLVSRKDFDRLRSHHWYAARSGKEAFYAAARIDGPDARVNHENGNGLDKRCNGESPRASRNQDGRPRPGCVVRGLPQRCKIKKTD